jgi:hypothetical protein
MYLLSPFGATLPSSIVLVPPGVNVKMLDGAQPPLSSVGEWFKSSLFNCLNVSLSARWACFFSAHWAGVQPLRSFCLLPRVPSKKTSSGVLMVLVLLVSVLRGSVAASVV